MATAVQVESLWNGLTDNSGQPLAAGKVYTYSAGTTTPVSLFTASDKSTSATNPIILDGNGKAQVWADGRYKFVVKTSADVTLYTLDNLLYGFDDTTVLYGGVSTGSANTQVVSVPATVTSYANGQTVSFIAGFTNTGATTLQFNSLSAISLVKGPTPSSLQAGDLIAGQMYTATYHGGSFRLTDYPTVADVQQSRFAVAGSVAGTNTITASLSPAPSAYETGMVVYLVLANTNTGAATLNLNSLGAKTIQRQGVALTGGELVANQPALLLYDGTNFHILSNNLGVGSAATPALYPGNDTNTGVFFPAADTWAVATNGSERVRVLSDGKVGIGTTAPADALEVATTSFFPQYWSSYPGASAGGTNLTLRRSRGATVGTNTILQDNDVVGAFGFQGANGTTFTQCATIGAAIDGTPGASNDMPGRLVFETTPDGSGSPVERMRIAANGRIAVGTTSTAAGKFVIRGEDATAGNWGLWVENSAGAQMLANLNSGLIQTGTAAQSPYNLTTGSGANVHVDSSGSLLRSTSSLKYKSNIQDSNHGLLEVLKLRSVTYTAQNSGETVFGGLIAEEVHDAGLSEFVLYNNDCEPDALHYGNMVALAFKAIQELNAKVEALQARVEELEGA
jgi:hypothetical protein